MVSLGTAQRRGGKAKAHEDGRELCSLCQKVWSSPILRAIAAECGSPCQWKEIHVAFTSFGHSADGDLASHRI